MDFDGGHCMANDAAFQAACPPEAVNLKATQVFCLSNLD